MARDVPTERDLKEIAEVHVYSVVVGLVGAALMPPPSPDAVLDQEGLINIEAWSDDLRLDAAMHQLCYLQRFLVVTKDRAQEGEVVAADYFDSRAAWRSPTAVLGHNDWASEAATVSRLNRRLGRIGIERIQQFDWSDVSPLIAHTATAFVSFVTDLSRLQKDRVEWFRPAGLIAANYTMHHPPPGVSPNA